MENPFPNDADMRAVETWLSVEHWLAYDAVGKYLMGRAETDRVAALQALAEVDPNDAENIRKLQNQARIPALFMQWLDEAIAEGQAAETRIYDEDSHVD